MPFERLEIKGASKQWLGTQAGSATAQTARLAVGSSSVTAQAKCGCELWKKRILQNSH